MTSTHCHRCSEPLTQHQQNYNQFYCSRECANTARRGVVMGKSYKAEIIKLARGGMTQHRIMARLNIPKGTVAYHLHRAREEGAEFPQFATGGGAHRKTKVHSRKEKDVD